MDKGRHLPEKLTRFLLPTLIVAVCLSLLAIVLQFIEGLAVQDEQASFVLLVIIYVLWAIAFAFVVAFIVLICLIKRAEKQESRSSN